MFLLVIFYLVVLHNEGYKESCFRIQSIKCISKSRSAVLHVCDCPGVWGCCVSQDELDHIRHTMEEELRQQRETMQCTKESMNQVKRDN